MDNRRTTTAIATGALALALSGGLAACQGGDQDDAAASTISSTTSSTTSTSTTETSTSSASSTPSSSSATSSFPTSSTPSSTSSTASGDCTASGLDVTLHDADKIPAKARPVAQAILDDATGCRTDALVRRSTADKTSLSFGAVGPKEVWALPDDESGRYWSTAAALGTPWGTTKNGSETYVVWPRVATVQYQDDDAAWQEAIDADLVTAEQAQVMRDGGSGYMGYRVGIEAQGNWLFAIAGD